MGVPVSQRQTRRLYGRRQGHRLRPRQAELVETLLPRLSVSLDAPLDLEPVFGAGAEIWFEIGFGAGEHLCAQAAAHPEVGLIGAEPYLNGVASLLARIEREALSNIRILKGDARALLDMMAPASLARAFLLFPDPWPKKRHARRRFITQETLDRLAFVLKDGAEFRVATDIDDYCAWTLAHLTAHASFEWRAARPADWRARPADWPETRYEMKAKAAGRSCVYLTFRRTPREAPR